MGRACGGGRRLQRDAASRSQVFDGERLEWLDATREDVIAFRRGGGVNVTVMSSFAHTPPSSWGRVVLRSQPGAGDTSAWLQA